MAHHGKKYRQVREKLDPTAVWDLEKALDFLKANKVSKFDETAELAIRLGVDPTKSEQMVRGTVALPHGTGKKVRVLVFAKGPPAEAAKEAGADYVGFEDLVAKVAAGWMDFDVAVATPEAMKEVRKLGKVLGPRGLMPNPKTGTVTPEVGKAVREIKSGKVEFRVDKTAIIHVPVGKISFSADALEENARSLITAVLRAKPASAKGKYVRSATICSTMGPGVALDISAMETK
jgi:large subunit ribosomal protein L1